MTSSGVFRAAESGREFTPVVGAPSAPQGAELLSDADGTPLLEVRTGDGLYRWPHLPRGRHPWIARGRRRHGELPMSNRVDYR